MTDEDEEFRPDEEDIGILGDITGKNVEGLDRLGKEEKSQELREESKYIRKLRRIYRKYFSRKEARTQRIEA